MKINAKDVNTIKTLLEVYKGVRDDDEVSLNRYTSRAGNDVDEVSCLAFAEALHDLEERLNQVEGEDDTISRTFHDQVVADLTRERDAARSLPHIFSDFEPKVDGVASIGMGIGIQAITDMGVGGHRVDVTFYVVRANVLRLTDEVLRYSDGQFYRWTRLKTFDESWKANLAKLVQRHIELAKG